LSEGVTWRLGAGHYLAELLIRWRRHERENPVVPFRPNPNEVKVVGEREIVAAVAIQVQWIVLGKKIGVQQHRGSRLEILDRSLGQGCGRPGQQPGQPKMR
jgi:hypothetical protein